MISFAEFFTLAHDDERIRGPHPWQERFAAACLAAAPPSLVAVPTGAGKTAVLDALLWALAMQADRVAVERTVGTRIVWAIDRRILVDEVHDYASRLAARLADAKSDGDPLAEVAARLRAIAGPRGERPLVITRWRGGIEGTARLDRDELPLSPTQPQIITSTIAQIGSRLLYRGYGVGRRSLSTQAGLAACDVNICIDEAHLASPFEETVEAVRADREAHSSTLALPPLNLVTLTATPARQRDDSITLSPADRKSLGPRYVGKKSARLDDSPGTDKERAKALADHAVRFLDGGRERIACVVNTVRQALAVHDLLAKIGAGTDFDLELLIGPQRPYDREQVLSGPMRRLFSAERGALPLICVATQTFEVGLDADVDALVTESASAAALTQRFGRLNRRGVGDGEAVVVRDADSWLYREDEPAAWRWLAALAGESGGVDISVSALERDRSRPAPGRLPRAPELRRDVVDRLVETSGRLGKYQEPAIEPFLVGTESDAADQVTICWRSDLRLEDDDLDADAGREFRIALLTLAPPVAAEKLSLSTRAARALIAAHFPAASTSASSALRAAATEADIEGVAAPEKTPLPDERVALPFLVIRRREVHEGTFGPGGEGEVGLAQLAPGDTIVLAERSGALTAEGLLAASPRAGRDVGPDVAAQSTVPQWVRISPETLSSGAGVPISQGRWDRVVVACAAAERARGAERDSRVAGLASTLASWLPEHPGLKKLAAMYADGNRLAIATVGEMPAGGDLDPEPDPSAGRGDGGELDPDEDSTKARASGPVWVLSVRSPDGGLGDRPTPPTLERHALAVRERAAAYGKTIGLAARIARTVTLAAAAHDHGKADPRVQAFYREGVTPIAEAPLAKSTFGTADRRRSRRARRLAELPSELRHEWLSAVILADALANDPRLAGLEIDPELAQHLVIVSHSENRPLPEPPPGGVPSIRVRCDLAGVAGEGFGGGVEGWWDGAALNRFWDVIGRYGAWGASYLEAVLTLADHRVSAEGC